MREPYRNAKSTCVIFVRKAPLISWWCCTKTEHGALQGDLKPNRPWLDDRSVTRPRAKGQLSACRAGGRGVPDAGVS